MTIKEKTCDQNNPSWKIRCMKCGFTESFDKYGIRKGGFGRPCTIMKCSRCKKIACHRIEKQKN